LKRFSKVDCDSFEKCDNAEFEKNFFRLNHFCQFDIFIYKEKTNEIIFTF